MNLEQISTLVAQNESDVVEFKKSTAQLKSACETACAFLNGDGGTILFGVTDNGKIVGQEVSDKTKRDIGHELVKITPNANIEVSYTDLSDNKKIIIFKVRTDHTKIPYLYDGKAFLRVQSTTVTMPRDHLKRLILLNNTDSKYAWENQVQPELTIDDLDAEEIILTIKEGLANDRIPANYSTNDPLVALQRLGLLNNGQITNAAMVLFGKDLRFRYPQCLLKLARFRGTNKAEFIDSKQVYGNIFKLLGAAMEFASSYLPVASTFSENDFFRKDTPLFPILALREAIANALIHRDYSTYGSSISFAIYDDRLEIWNYGLPPDGTTAADLPLLNRSTPRNPNIANVLYYHKIFESWGRGIHMIIEKCKEAGHPTPFYELDKIGTALILPSKQLIGAGYATQLANNDIPPLTIRQKEILTLLMQHKESTSSLIKHQLGDSVSERYIRKELSRLKDLGYIDYIGNTRARRWFLLKPLS